MGGRVAVSNADIAEVAHAASDACHTPITAKVPRGDLFTIHAHGDELSSFTNKREMFLYLKGMQVGCQVKK